MPSNNAAKRSFLDMLMGRSVMDNTSNPNSPYNRRLNDIKPVPVNEQTDQMRRHLELMQRQRPASSGIGWGP